MPLEIDEWGEGRNNGNAAADEIDSSPPYMSDE